MRHGDGSRPRNSDGKAHPCLRCNSSRLWWDVEDEEWACPICGARYPDGSTAPDAELTGPARRVQSQPCVEESPRCSQCIGQVPGLRCVRLARHWTQEELARRIGTTRESVINWESGRGAPSFDMTLRILDTLQVTIADLVCRDVGATGRNVDSCTHVVRSR